MKRRITVKIDHLSFDRASGLDPASLEKAIARKLQGVFDENRGVLAGQLGRLEASLNPASNAPAAIADVVANAVAPRGASKGGPPRKERVR